MSERRATEEFSRMKLEKQHVRDCLEIEEKAFGYYDQDMEHDAIRFHSWTREDIEEVLSEKGTRGWVLTEGDVVVGYVIYELAHDSIIIRRLLVHPFFRNVGVGLYALEMLIRKSENDQKRHTLTAYIREDLDPQWDTCKWFAHRGFTPKLRRRFESDGTDAFEYSYYCVDEARNTESKFAAF